MKNNLIEKAALIVFAAIPLIVTAAVLAWRPPAFSFVDPDAAYYAAAVSLVDTGVVHFRDHPGTPYQAFLAGCLAPVAVTVKAAGGSFSDYAFHNADALYIYLQLCGAVLLSVGVLLWGLGFKRLFGDRNNIAALAAVLVVFLVPPVRQNIMRLRPELMLVFLSGLWMFFFGAAWGRGGAPNLKSIMACQFICGLAMAVKVSAFPLLAFSTLFLFAAKGRLWGSALPLRTAVAVGLGLPVLGFFFGILPIIHLAGEFWLWVVGVLSTSAERAGTAGAFLEGLGATFWFRIKYAAPTLLLAMALVAVNLVLPNKKGARSGVPYSLVLICATPVYLVSMFVMSFHGFIHYSAVADLILAFLIIFLFMESDALRSPRLRALALAGLMTWASVGVYGTTDLNKGLFIYMREYRQGLDAMSSYAESRAQPIVFGHFAFTRNAALLWGGTYGGGPFAGALEAEHPRLMVWCHWLDRLYDYRGAHKLTEINWKYMVLFRPIYEDDFLEKHPDVGHEVIGVIGEAVVISNPEFDAVE